MFWEQSRTLSLSILFGVFGFNLFFFGWGFGLIFPDEKLNSRFNFFTQKLSSLQCKMSYKTQYMKNYTEFSFFQWIISFTITIGVNNNNEKINTQTNGYERTEKVQNQYETPHEILKPAFSTGFLEKSRNFSKNGNGLHPIPIFSKVFNFSQNTL